MDQREELIEEPVDSGLEWAAALEDKRGDMRGQREWDLEAEVREDKGVWVLDRTEQEEGGTVGGVYGIGPLNRIKV